MFIIKTLHFSIIIQFCFKKNQSQHIYIFECFHQELFFHAFGFNMSNGFKMTNIFVTSSFSRFNYTYF
jgi:hypothetical protein